MEIKTAAIIFGIAFLAIGLLGFIPNPIVGTHDAIFHADTVHSVVHIISGILFFVFAYALPVNLATFMKIFGAFYFLLGVLGMLNIGSEGMTRLLGFLHVNGADNYLHLVLGLLIFLAGMMKTRRVLNM